MRGTFVDQGGLFSYIAPAGRLSGALSFHAVATSLFRAMERLVGCL